MAPDPKRFPAGGEPTTDPGLDHPVESITQADAHVGFAPTLTRAVGDSNPGALDGLATELVGRYQRRGELGRGGQSIVTRAWDAQLGREVAIKELNEGSSGSAPERFLREARITARLEHPNIVPVYEIGRRPDGTLYSVQKLVRPSTEDGQPRTLRRAISEAATLDQRLLLLPHFVDLCHGIAFAHAQGVLHRDIKPENVVVGRFGETVILDWGLARDGDDHARPAVNSDGAPSATVAGLAYGTPSYMSPEQARGETTSLDARADVFSLGAVLFEILTGRPPFIGGSAAQIVQQVLHAPVPDPSSLAPQAPRELVAIAARALQKDRTARFASAQAIADEVSAWQNGRRVSVYSYSLFELLRLFLTRHRLASTIAVAAFVLISAMGAFAWSRYGKARIALSLALVERAHQADRALMWNQAALLYAAARASDDNPVTQWGVRISGTRRTQTPTLLTGHSAGSRGVAFSPDGRFVATAGIGGGVRIFKSPEGTLEATLWEHGNRDVTSVSWSPDGMYLVSTSEDGRAVLWDARQRTMLRVLSKTQYSLNAFAFSPDQKLGVVGAEAGWIELVDLVNDVPPKRILIEPHPVYTVAFHPSGRFFAVGSWSGIVRILRRDGSEDQVVNNKGAGLRDIKFSPDGRFFASTGTDHLVRIYSVTLSGDQLTLESSQVLEGHDRKVMGLSFSPDSQRLASASTDRTVRMWGVRDGRSQIAQSLGGDEQALSVAFDPSGKILAVARADASAELHRIAPEDSVGGFPSGGRRYGLSAAIATSRVLTAADKTYLLEGAELTTRRSYDWLPTSGNDLEITRNGRFIAWPCVSGAESPPGFYVCWADLEAGGELQKISAPVSIIAVGISPSGDLLVANNGGELLYLWSLPDGTPRGTLKGGPTAIFDFDFSPDGKLLASGGYDKRIFVWDVATREPLKVLEGHTHGVRRVRFSPDGKTLASSGWDTTLRLWDVATLTPRATCRGHEDHVFGLDWAPDSSWLVSGARDGTLRIWDPRDCTELAQIVADEGQVFATAVPSDGAAILYQGTQMRRFPLSPLGDPATLLHELERETGLVVDGAKLVPRLSR